MAEPSDELWLVRFLKHVAEAGGYCTRCSCTLCGADRFLSEFLLRAAIASGDTGLAEHMSTRISTVERTGYPRSHKLAFFMFGSLSKPLMQTIFRGLATIRPEDARGILEDPVRLLFFRLYGMGDAGTIDVEYRPLIEGTWAGELLTRMETHAHDRAVAYHRGVNEREVAQKRRAERRAQRAVEHEIRMRLQKEQSRRWHEANGTDRT